MKVYIGRGGQKPAFFPYLRALIDEKIAGASLSIKKESYGNKQNTAGGKITTQLQKRFLLVFWTDVDGGYWVDESSESSYTAVHTLAVQTGTYRVKVEYLIYGTDGSVETVNDEAEYTYK